ncbi:hypothetical protein QPM17_00450 [Marinobacter sp. TBZ242]|uniref:DNA-binding protein n=1 Tax=Marinobacter azerbaijanicus TaxID=3050455 RepID=A0ABT7I666_9GAMM|nr:hypothetical protein [Marinobacter sp. TBZ242]MDL0429581.1 hypothetical protein [Marinobacter sp. TBZ242]
MTYEPPGVFTRSNGERLFALSNIHKLTGVPAHEIVDAILKEKLTIELVNGCKCVREPELKQYLDGRAANGK